MAPTAARRRYPVSGKAERPFGVEAKAEGRDSARLLAELEAQRLEQKRMDAELGRLTTVEFQLAESKAKLLMAEEQIQESKGAASKAERAALKEEEKALLREKKRQEAFAQAIEANEKLHDLGAEKDMWMKEARETKKKLEASQQEAEAAQSMVSELRDALRQAVQNINHEKDARQKVVASQGEMQQYSMELEALVEIAEGECNAMEEATAVSQDEARALAREVGQLKHNVTRLERENKSLRETKVLAEKRLGAELVASKKMLLSSEAANQKIVESFLEHSRDLPSSHWDPMADTAFAELDSVLEAVKETRMGLPKGELVRYEVSAGPYNEIATSRWALGSSVAHAAAQDWRQKSKDVRALCQEVDQQLSYGTVSPYATA